AEVIDNPFKIACCGSYHTIENKDIVRNRSHRITNYATDLGAEAMVLSCPLCKYNLDYRGKEAEKIFKGYKQIPIYYYTQLIAIALGLDQKICSFDEHIVDPTLLLKKKGILTE
ncbi:heterodisulfide reductase, subunit B, partial [Candidatus Bathyarchaeota archaeon]